MFRIAICDDNCIFTSNFQKQIQLILEKQNVKHVIDCFDNVKEFIQEIESGLYYQLLFLDIEFPNTNLDGISCADYIRTSLSELGTSIVFISTQPKYALQLFDFQPLQFLIKPIDVKKLETTIIKAIQLSNHKNQTVHFISNRETLSMDIKNILYIESFGRKKTLYCSSGRTYIVNDTFSNILQQLQPYDFFSPHKSYIVNYHQVRIWHKDMLEMENGVSIPIGRSKIKEVQELQLQKFLT